MMRKTYGTLLMLAVAALVMVGCGTDDVTDLSDTWTKREGDVVTKLEEVRRKNTELTSKLQAVNTSSITDSTKLADRTMVETTLSEYMTKIGEVEATINALKTKRDSAAALGNRAEYEALWKSADVEYTAAIEKLDQMENDYNALENRLDDLTAPSAIDTAATSSGADTANASAATNATTDNNKPAEDASKKDEAKKAEDTASAK